MDTADQQLAYIAREVEVDVGQRAELRVEEAPHSQATGERIDMRKPGEETDDRRHRGATSSSRRQQRPRRVRSTYFRGDLTRELEDLMVQQEEPGERELLDHDQLLFEPSASLSEPHSLVALAQACTAELGEASPSVWVLDAGVAVAEVRGEVEAQLLGERCTVRKRLRIIGEARCHRRRRGEHVGAVGPSYRFA
jgi:hypothetical protein